MNKMKVFGMVCAISLTIAGCVGENVNTVADGVTPTQSIESEPKQDKEISVPEQGAEKKVALEFTGTIMEDKTEEMQAHILVQVDTEYAMEIPYETILFELTPEQKEWESKTDKKVHIVCKTSFEETGSEWVIGELISIEEVGSPEVELPSGEHEAEEKEGNDLPLEQGTGVAEEPKKEDVYTGETSGIEVSFDDPDNPVEEQNYDVGEPKIEGNSTITLEVATQLQEKISEAMVNKELPFVISSAVYENPYRVHVVVTSKDENDLEKLRGFDSLGALEIEYAEENTNVLE